MGLGLGLGLRLLDAVGRGEGDALQSDAEGGLVRVRLRVKG